VVLYRGWQLIEIMKIYRGSRGIVLLIPNVSTKWRLAVNFLPQLLYSLEGTPKFIEYEAGWAAEPVWMIWEERNISFPCWNLHPILSSQRYLCHHTNYTIPALLKMSPNLRHQNCCICTYS
jgi:hypothetical protein